MKKISLALCVAGLFSFASADFLSISAGIGIEKQNISGYVKNGDTINYFDNKSAETDGNPKTGNFGLKTKNNPYIWVKFIHPIPIIPNIKLEYTKYSTTGYSSYIAAGQKIFGDVNINAALTDATTNFDINSYSASLFYEFKPVILDIEIGLGASYWKGHTKIYGTDTVTHTTKTWVDSKWSVVIPYLYGNLETMKLFNTSIYTNFKVAKAGDNHYYKYDAGIKYTIDILGPVNPNIKIGYKYLSTQAVDGDDKTLLKYKGPYIELGFKF